MKVKTRKIYYCDFCKKHYHIKPSIILHEKHCTLNPNRICRLCGRTDINIIIPKYQTGIRKQWDKLRDEVKGCPNCILTVIRCNPYEHPIDIGFNYKEELEKWWGRVNDERKEQEFRDLQDEVQQL